MCWRIRNYQLCGPICRLVRLYWSPRYTAASRLTGRFPQRRHGRPGWHRRYSMLRIEVIAHLHFPVACMTSLSTLPRVCRSGAPADLFTKDYL